MFSKAYCAAIIGIDAVIVQVEADVSNGLPSFDLVGFLASEVKEAKERVRVAIKNSRFVLPPKKVTINLSPADIRKEGTAFDLPIAVSILTAFGFIPEECLHNKIFIGELSLDGRLNPINGVLPMVYAASLRGIKECFVPQKNAKEAAAIKGIKVYGVKTLVQAIDYILGKEKPIEEYFNLDMIYEKAEADRGKLDFSDIVGQVTAKRAIEVAVAGQHNILMIGSPGAGKTMLAKRIPDIMPEMTFEESIEVSRIYSVAGELSESQSLIVKRPFRSPHHTITRIALAGGGRVSKPGEISLATHGVLFLDELPEFARDVIEILRQPLEERTITISRMQGRHTFPAGFMMVAAMNPCMCGYYPDRNRCSCNNQQIKRYLSRISRPIIDRIDICTEVPAVEYKNLIVNEESNNNIKIESTKQIRERISIARDIQQERYKGMGIYFNSQLEAVDIKHYCGLGLKEKKLLAKAFDKFNLSARGYHRVLKTARTIADLDGVTELSVKHLTEALSYRTIDQRIWGNETYG